MLAAAMLLACLPQGEPPALPQDEYRPPGYVYARMPSPWGPAEGWEIGEFRIKPRGFLLGAGLFTAEDLDVDVPRAMTVESDGINYPRSASYEYRRMDIDAAGASATLDLDGLRFTVLAFWGDMDARGTLVWDDGLNPAQVTDVDVEGDVYGFRVSGYWPGIRYRDRILDASIGPALGVGWMHTEVDQVPGSPLELSDETDQLLVTMGARVSVRVMLGRWAVGAEAEVCAIGGDSRGLGIELTLGAGFSF